MNYINWLILTCADLPGKVQVRILMYTKYLFKKKNIMMVQPVKTAIKIVKNVKVLKKLIVWVVLVN